MCKPIFIKPLFLISQFKMMLISVIWKLKVKIIFILAIFQVQFLYI